MPWNAPTKASFVPGCSGLERGIHATARRDQTPCRLARVQISGAAPPDCTEISGMSRNCQRQYMCFWPVSRNWGTYRDTRPATASADAVADSSALSPLDADHVLLFRVRS